MFSSRYSGISSLALMQHHGLPTRTLDLTGNALIALFFACADSPKRPRQTEATRAGSVLLFSADSKEFISSKQPIYFDGYFDDKLREVHRPSLKNVQSDTAAITSALAKLSFERKEQIYAAFYNALRKNGNVVFAEKLSEVGTNGRDPELVYQEAFDNYPLVLEHFRKVRTTFNESESVEYLCREIQKQSPVFVGKEINPFDLFRDVIIRLDQNDPRIIRQDGYLLLCGELFSPENLKFDFHPIERGSGKKTWPFTRVQREADFRIKNLRLKNSDSKPVRLIVPVMFKKTILNQLAVLGISKATVYLDVDHKAEMVSTMISGWDVQGTQEMDEDIE